MHCIILDIVIQIIIAFQCVTIIIIIALRWEKKLVFAYIFCSVIMIMEQDHGLTAKSRMRNVNEVISIALDCRLEYPKHGPFPHCKSTLKKRFLQFEK